MRKSKLMLGLAIVATIAGLATVATSLSGGGFVGDKPLWVRYVFVISGILFLVSSLSMLAFFLVKEEREIMRLRREIKK